MKNKKKTLRKVVLSCIVGVVVGMGLMFGTLRVFDVTSTNESCEACHIHPQSSESWKKSVHYNSKSGVKTNCVDCHLPPKGDMKYYAAKVKTGVKDMWSYITKDSADINWDQKSELEYAHKFVYNESCKKCHTNLFPSRLGDDGINAHIYYEENETKLDLQCISCHLDAGHYNPNYQHKKMSGMPKAVASNTIVYTEPTKVTSFESFVEYIPGTVASINMKAIPGGTFKMGSAKGDAFANEDEMPQRDVAVSDFFMSDIEVTWDQYWAFFGETFSEGRTPPEVIYANNTNPDADAVSGPTPPFGAPDQGWGSGSRPAITMTHYAAETFCQWLSKKTGKKYRLPTEAEWEYAARGGSQTPYFFEGNPKKFSDQGFIRKFIDADTAVINRFVIYGKNSGNKTQEPAKVGANPFGLKNMLGNVMEYCSDYYDPEAYSKTEASVTNPKGPSSGVEYVVRGGDYKSDAADVRSASRGFTHHDDWLKTDPQKPKSIWWYSDIKGIGFRVVCSSDEAINK